jgi:hypothetical protein
MLRIQCNQCGRSVVTTDGSDPDSALLCDCCPEDHHHGEAANATGTACRPITITPAAVGVS